MDIHPYAGSYAQSLNFGEEQTQSQSSTYKVNVVAFKRLPRCLSRQFSDLGDVSMEDSVHHQIVKKQTKEYKCFKCFGRNKKQQENGLPPKCRQCSGSQYIPQSHPLVAIMEKLIKKKMPHLSLKHYQQKKNENKRQTLELQYGCKEVIKEQSFSYQEQSPPFCRNCNKQCDANCYRICQRCSDFNICQTCFEKRRFNHPHPLILKDTSKMPSNISQALSNMKKISEKVDSQSEHYLQKLEFKCTNCREAIDICYDACITCQQNGQKYLICNSCSQYQSYQHNPSHVLVMRTMTQISDLNRVQSTNSVQEQNLEINSLSNSKIQNERSIIKLHHQLISQSFENNHHKSSDFSKSSQLIPDEIKFNFSDHMSGFQSIEIKLSNSFQNDSQFQKISHKKYFEGKHSIQSSLNGNDLSSSFQFQKSAKGQQIQPQSPGLSFIPIFNSVTHELAQKPHTNPQELYVFNDYQCDICGVQPIKNKRFHCTECQNFDLCQQCHMIRSKRHQHRTFQQIDGRLLKKQRDSIIQLNQSRNLQSTVLNNKIGTDMKHTFK